MPEPGETPRDDHVEVLSLAQLIERVEGLVDRYRMRERANSADVIGGSSRFLLLRLLKAAMPHLPQSEVSDAIQRRLSDPVSDFPDIDPRVSDELDLLEQVATELRRAQTSGTPRSRSTTRRRRSTSEETWEGGPTGRGSPQHHDRSMIQLSPAEKNHLHYAVFHADG
jgi:hypothetical protein